MSHKLTLQEGAILIADAHYSARSPQFLSFLKDIKNKKIQTKQLIFMGDMFELLFGTIKQTIKDNSEEVELINEISLEIEVIYFEGNHDFNIKKVFPHVEIFSLKSQPQKFNFKNQTILLSHGDTNTPLAYQIYTKLIRNRVILSFIGFLDILCSNCIIKWLKSRGEDKDQCYKMNNFEEIIKKRLSEFDGKNIDVIIEGHFHQDRSFHIHNFFYVNLASFSCNQKYFIVQSSKEQFYLQSESFEESK